MTSWLAALALVLAQDPPAQDPPPVEKQLAELRDEVERLKRQMALMEADKDRLLRENAALRRELESLRLATEESAREALLMKQALQESTAAPAKGAETTPAPQPDPPKALPGTAREGPSEPLRGKVIGSNPEFSFVVIDKGEAHGIKPGWRFDILRRVRVRAEGQPDTWRFEKLGVAEFEKFLGDLNEQSKLKVVEGKAGDMKYEDEAVAHRKMELTGDAPAAAPEVGPKKYAITGKVGDAFMLSYGTKDNAKQSDRVFVYRDNRQRAQLRLEMVDRDWSVGKLIDKTQTGEFGIGDEVLVKEQKVAIVGRVKWNDDKRGIILEAGAKDGVKAGMQFEVRRQGRKMGVLVVKTVDKFTCAAEPSGDLKREDVQVGDFVESAE